MSAARALKEIVWIAPARRDLKVMPAEIQDKIGLALELVQWGKTPDSAKPMKGNLRDVMEIQAGAGAGNSSYRAVYTTLLGEIVYVLDVFQKKSKKGIATPRIDLARIAHRLKQARKRHAENTHSQ
jgi:phage-related protein